MRSLLRFTAAPVSRSKTQTGSSWPTARKRAAYLRVNDSREWGVAWAQRCHHRARTISIKRSTSSAVVANEVTRRTSVPSRAGMELLAGEGIAHG
jgi:hypothetical protein